MVLLYRENPGYASGAAGQGTKTRWRTNAHKQFL